MAPTLLMILIHFLKLQLERDEQWSLAKVISFATPSSLSLVFNKVLVLLTLLIIVLGDKLVGEVSRLVVAEACIQALDIESTEGQIYEINSVKVFGFFFPVVYNTIGYRRLFSRIDTRIHVIKLVTEITTVFSHELISHSQLVSRQLPNQQLNHSFYHT